MYVALWLKLFCEHDTVNAELIEKLQYSYVGQNEAHQLPLSLKVSLNLISAFFSNSTTNKLSLVFPSKEYVAQWLAIPTVLSLIEAEFAQFKGQIYESYKQYKQGDKLILNNKAIVEWAGIKGVNSADFIGPSFRTKHCGESSGVEIIIKFSDVIKLQKAPPSRKALSSIRTVKEALPLRDRTPTETLLQIDTFGNKEFIKNSICLIGKLKSYDDSVQDIKLNHAMLSDYFTAAKIDDSGNVNDVSPLLIANNLSNLYLYLAQSKTTSQIIIDGYSAINERGTDFADIDALNIPTILITDLSEIDAFENIGNYGFDFFNFTKENLKPIAVSNHSPFHSFEKKVTNYISFNLRREICNNADIEAIAHKIHSIERDDSNNDLKTLLILLIQLTNHVSRIAHIPTEGEISKLTSNLDKIENLFQSCRLWLGDSHKPIEECISLFRNVITELTSVPSAKCLRLKELLTESPYDCIICPTEYETKVLTDFINTSSFTCRPRIMSVADVNDKLLAQRQTSAILTGWAKSNMMSRLLSSFLFSEVTVLFYQFEDRYYNSLQRRHRRYNENIKATINSKGIRSKGDTPKPKGFDDFYSADELAETKSVSSFDISDFELTLDNAQYSKYAAKSTLIESIKAKRIDFEDSFFIYSAESHKFLVINELIEKAVAKPDIYRKKSDSLKPGDVIAFINTDKDILVELVEKNTNTKELASVKQWTELWKNLLKDHFASVAYVFRKLIDDLRKHDCKKHETTVRTWLQEESRIGPEDDADLISIALMTNSSLLFDNITTVREAISKMKGWRMTASDYITDKIKSQIHEFADASIINRTISVTGLGSVIVLKVIEISTSWENIDVRYVHKLLHKELI
jgi:hypothetical protein